MFEIWDDKVSGLYERTAGIMIQFLSCIGTSFFVWSYVPVSRVQGFTLDKCTIDSEVFLYAPVLRVRAGSLSRPLRSESCLPRASLPLQGSSGAVTKCSGSFFGLNNEELGLKISLSQECNSFRISQVLCTSKSMKNSLVDSVIRSVPQHQKHQIIVIFIYVQDWSNPGIRIDRYETPRFKKFTRMSVVCTWVWCVSIHRQHQDESGNTYSSPLDDKILLLQKDIWIDFLVKVTQNFEASDACGSPKLVVLVVSSPENWPPQCLHSALSTIFDSIHAQIFLFSRLPFFPAFHTNLWLPRRHRADSLSVQSDTTIPHWRTLHCNEWCLCFLF